VHFRRCVQVATVDRVDDDAIRRGCDVCRHADESHGTNGQVRQYVCVVAGEVDQIGLVEYTADFTEVTLRVFHTNNARVLREAQDCFVLDGDARATRNVIDEHGQLGRIRNHAEMREYTGLCWLVVIRCHGHDAVSTGLFRLFCKFDGVRGLVRRAAHDDLGPRASDLLTHLDESHFLRVSQRGCFARRSGHHNAIRAVADDIVNQSLDVVPVNFTIVSEGRHQCDEYLSKRVFSHEARLSVCRQ
jgi:hypothetical protein